MSAATGSQRSLRSTSLQRLVGDSLTLGFGFLTGVVTARNLGPAAKGGLSTLSYLVALTWPLAALGAGEAGVALAGRGRTTVESAVRTSLAIVAVTGALAVPLILLLSLVPPLGVSGFHGARLAAAAAAPLTALVGVLPHFLELRGRFDVTLLSRAAAAVTTFGATLYLVTVRSLAVAGAMAAVTLGAAVGVAVLTIGLWRAALPVRPRFERALLVMTVRSGAPIMLGLVAVIGAARLDLLIVAAFRSNDEVGLYSAALTVAQLAGVVPLAIAYAGVPRLATASADEAGPLARKLLRAGAGTALATAAVVAVTAGFVIPAAFGEGFRGAVGPTLGLLPAGVATGVQWIAVRGSVARGRSSAMLRTFVPTVVAMIMLDLVLIPTGGLAGAAAAAGIAAVIGACIALADLRRALALPMEST